MNTGSSMHVLVRSAFCAHKARLQKMVFVFESCLHRLRVVQYAVVVIQYQRTRNTELPIIGTSTPVGH